MNLSGVGVAAWSLWLMALAGCAPVAHIAAKDTPPSIPPARVALRAEAPSPSFTEPAEPRHPAVPMSAAPTRIPDAAVAPALPASPPPAAAPTSPASTPSASPQAQVVLNFDNADVEVVVQAAAEIVGFNYVLGPNVRGKKVTFQTAGPIARERVFPVLLTVLDVNGLAAVKSDSIYRIIAREGAVQSAVRIVVGRDTSPGPPADEVVTQVIPLQFLGAPDALSLLRPFISSPAGLGAHRESNHVIVTDTAANVRRILDILALVDVPVAADELQIIPLRHADAQELSQILTQFFAGNRPRDRTAAVTASVAGLADAAPPGAPRPASAPVDSPVSTDRPPMIAVERRTNSLVVHARRQEMETVRRLVERLDVDVHGGQRVFIHFAENTKARDLATTLDAIYSRGERLAAGPPGRAIVAAGVVGPGAPPLPLPLFPLASGAPGRLSATSGLPLEGASAQTEIRFIADEVTNAVIVTTLPRLWKEIEETIKRLDKMPRQVLIEVLAAEVTLTDDTKLGLEWAFRSGRFDVSSSPSGNLPGRPPRTLIPLGGVVPAGLNVFVFAAEEFLAALNALANENKVNVLSSPSVMTTENKKAVINVSTSVPIVTSQQVPVAAGGVTGNSITQAVEYRDAGIILTVTPRIGEQGTVALDVKQEVNEIGQTEPPPINSPRFIKREAETSVVLLNNQTLVLGGLIQNKRTVVRTGIPFLNRIPVLGLLFGAIQEKIEKTELVLLITPRVVGTALDAARVTERMRRITPELEESIKRAPRPPSPMPTE
jgi:general secretion pathway protein D